VFYINPTHFSAFNASGKPLLSATAALAPLTMFAYLGLESATVPAGDVKNPERTIPRSTIIGIVVATLLYVLGTIAVMGIVPREQSRRSCPLSWYCFKRPGPPDSSPFTPL
jgi:amino acid transporter